MTDLNATADRIVRQDVHLCLSSMVATLAQGYGHADRSDSRLRDLDNLAEQASELCAPRLDYEETARQAGWTHHADDAEDGGYWSHDDYDDIHGDAYDVCDEHDLDAYEWDVFEHWAVSTWLAEKLTAAGERVDTDFAGLNVWARTTTGQAISMDAVIQRIAADVEAAR